MTLEQRKIILRYCGPISPENIAEYIAGGGYSGLEKALKLSPKEVIEEVTRSGLRGRVSGFPTGNRWSLCQDASGSEKYFICNAAGSGSDLNIGRLLLETDPHSVLEGMLIGAYAAGATHGYLYINAENSLSVERFNQAIKQLKEEGLLARSGFSLQVEVRVGGSCLQSGEETAVTRTLDLKGKPTVINSVETLANVAAIFQKGSEWYNNFGIKESKGTKIFSLSGRVKNPGIVEMALGTSFRQIINDLGGGLLEGRDFKAVLVGGPLGGFLPENALDLPVDYETFTAEGLIMGTGSLQAVGQDICIVELAKDCLTISQAESCGRCVFCREGTKQMLYILTDITLGKGKPEDIDLLLELGEAMKAGSLCTFGKTAPNPVLTTIKHFREEYEAHIKRKRCPAMVCKKFISYHILPEKCHGCQLCQQQCPAGAIEGDEQMIHVIDEDLCKKCGTCLVVCPAKYNAVTKAGGVKPKTPDEPIPVGTWKKRR